MFVVDRASLILGMASGRSKVAAAASPEQELADLQRKYSLLEGDRKAFYETSQWTIKQNQETLAAAKQEGKELRAELVKRNNQKAVAGSVRPCVDQGSPARAQRVAGCGRAGEAYELRGRPAETPRRGEAAGQPQGAGAADTGGQRQGAGAWLPSSSGAAHARPGRTWSWTQRSWWRATRR